MFPARGIWKCRLPDGSYNEVHHCYDFGVTLMTIGDMMPATQKKEMVEFLHTRTENADVDACAFDQRPRRDVQHSAPTINGREHTVRGLHWP